MPGADDLSPTLGRRERFGQPSHAPTLGGNRQQCGTLEVGHHIIVIRPRCGLPAERRIGTVANIVISHQSSLAVAIIKLDDGT